MLVISTTQSQMVSALATSAITGNNLDIDPQQMLKTALAAGASQFAMKELGVQTAYDKTKSFDTNLVGGIQRAGVNSVVGTAINGGSLSDNLKNNLGSEVLSVTSAKLANEIGLNQENLGEVGHKVAHAALGCAGAKVQGKDCASGAVGAVVGEVIAEQVGKNQELTGDDVQAISRIGAATIAQGLGKDAQVADKAAENAVENNYLTLIGRDLNTELLGVNMLGVMDAKHGFNVISGDNPDYFTQEQKAKFGEPIDLGSGKVGYLLEDLNIDGKLVSTVNGKMKDNNSNWVAAPNAQASINEYINQQIHPDPDDMATIRQHSDNPLVEAKVLDNFNPVSIADSPNYPQNSFNCGLSGNKCASEDLPNSNEAARKTYEISGHKPITFDELESLKNNEAGAYFPGILPKDRIPQPDETQQAIDNVTP